MPVADDYAAEDCALFLWSTWPLLQEGLEVMRAWGFNYVTGFPWLKINKAVEIQGQVTIVPQYGVGFWVRGCTEPLLIGRRGKPALPEGQFVGLLSPNLHHSRKPDNLYHIAETMEGPYLELFARRSRVGWDSTGNQIDISSNGHSQASIFQ